MNHVLKSDMERGAERSQVIDVAKGFLMLLVVIGHAIQFVGYMGNSNFWSDPLLILIYIFHMPLFMAFSGYLSPQRVINWLDIYRRIKTLIYPMFVFGGFVAVIRGCYKGDYFSILYGALDGFLNIYWFLWATLLCYVIVGLSEKAKSGAVVAYIFAFALMVFFRDSWVVLPMLAFVLPFFVICRWARRSGRFSKWALERVMNSQSS